MFWPDGQGGWMGRPNGRGDWRDTIPLKPAQKPVRAAVDPELADRVNRVLLDRLTLSDQHRDALRARGMTDRQIDRDGYPTGPTNRQERQALAAAIIEELGFDPAGKVPGFTRRGGTPDLVLGDAELLIPCRDDQDRIVGVRRRLNDAKDGKYRWMSAGDGPHSVGIDGNTVHVARPDRVVSTRRVVVTEGEIKANIVAELLGCIVVSVPGVSNTAHVVATLQAIGGVEEVAIAYDAEQNPHVIAAETRLAHEVAAAGFEVCQWVWDCEHGKGIDDLLTNTETPSVMRVPWARTYPAPTEPDDEHIGESVGRRLEQLQAQNQSLVWLNRTRKHLQRNGRLPARGMAIATVDYLSHAATASNPAGDYTGKVPAGYVLASVKGLSEEAGTKPNNGGNNLEALKEAGLIERMTIRETIPSGQINPDTGEILRTPLIYSRHFIAIAGHEDQPLTQEAVHELAERMIRYDPGTPERRGGARIPRCKDHPDAPVHRHWVATCSVCDKELDRGLPQQVAEMHLEPRGTVQQSLLDRKTGTDDAVASGAMPTSKAPLHFVPHIDDAHLGKPSIAHKVDQTEAIGTVQQSLLDRRRWAAEDLERWQDRSLADDAGDKTPDVYEAQQVLSFASQAAPEAAKPALADLDGLLARVAVKRGRRPIPKPQSTPTAPAAAPPDPWDSPHQWGAD